MKQFNQTPYQKEQIKVIDGIERQIVNKQMQFTTVQPVEDYLNDTRICLTSIHFPHKELADYIETTVISPFREIAPQHHYYDASTLHMTIKNIRVIQDPPSFDERDISKVINVFEEIVPKYKAFRVFFYRLLLFPANLVLMGTTDPELDNLIDDLNNGLIRAGIPDDKQYSNNRFFFINITLVRFTSSVSQQFKEKVTSLSSLALEIPIYTVDSVSLVTGNAVLKKLRIIDTFHLLPP